MGKIMTNAEVASVECVKDRIYHNNPAIAWSDRLTGLDVEIIIAEAMYYQRIACGRIYKESKNRKDFNEFYLYNAEMTREDLDGEV